MAFLSAPPRQPARPVIVVLGSGRSGTSLLMQGLAALGMGVSQQLIEARRDNPRGFFEDARIVRIQADLMRSLGAWPYHSLPAGWLDAPASTLAARELGGLLEARLGQALEDGAAPWGFKDPRTAPFLPLWQKLFNELGIAPRYVLALREPGSIIRSFMAAYQSPPETAEEVWLRRTCDALWHTRADCHIVHYEDWFSRGREVALGLARFSGLDGARVEAALETLIRPDLNRARTAGYVLGSPVARALQARLETCRGSDFDPGDLLPAVIACRRHLGLTE